MPMIETTALPDTSALDGAVLTLCDYNLIVFPSRSSIYHFARSLLTAIPLPSSSSSSSSFGDVPTIDRSGITTSTGPEQSGTGNDDSAETDADTTGDALVSSPSPSVLASASKSATIDPVLLLRASGVRTAALGADARYVREQLGVTVDYIPPFATPAGLCAFLAADPDLRGKRVLVPVPVVQGMREPPVIPQLLHDLEHNVGCIVTAVPAYCTKPTTADRVAVELDLLCRDGAVDAVLVSSTAEANALHAVLANAAAGVGVGDGERDGTKPPLDAFVERVRERSILIAAHGPVTARGVAQAFDDFRCVGDDGASDGANAVANDDVDVDAIVVSKNCSTFDGVADALEEEFVTRFVKEQGKILL